MKYQKYIDLFRKKHMLLLTGEPDMELDIIAQDIAAQMILGRDDVEHLSKDEKHVLDEHISYYSEDSDSIKNLADFEKAIKQVLEKSNNDNSNYLGDNIIAERFRELCDSIRKRDVKRLACRDSKGKERNWLTIYDEENYVILVEGDRCTIKTIKKAYYNEHIQDINTLDGLMASALKKLLAGDVAHVYAILRYLLTEGKAFGTIEDAFSHLWDKVRKGDIKALPMKRGKLTSRLFVDEENKDTIYFVQQNDGFGVNAEKVISAMGRLNGMKLSRGMEAAIRKIKPDYETAKTSMNASFPYVLIIDEIGSNKISDLHDVLKDSLVGMSSDNMYILAAMNNAEKIDFENDVSKIFTAIEVPANNSSAKSYTSRTRLEGRIAETKVLRRYRNRAARQQCLEASGYTCYVCNFNFEKFYGSIGKDFLEVHHKKPLASYSQEHEIPVGELCALCSNCHSMVHRTREARDVDDLKKAIAANRSQPH